MGDLYIKNKKVSGTVSSASAVTCKDIAGKKHTLQKVLDNRPVNNNILINSNFANPVNQRGVVSPYTAPQHKTYWIDRWKIKGVNGQGIFSLVDKGIKIKQPDGENCVLTQHIEISKDYFGKKATLSIYINGVVHSLTTTFPSEMPTDEFYVRSNDFDDKTALAIGISVSLQCFYIELYINGSGSKTIEWVKLELCDHATPYVPRLYAEELRLCKRYYQKFYLGATADSVSTQSAGVTATIPCEAMRIDKPTIDASNVVVIHNGSSTTGFTLDNAACVTSQCKFYIRFKHSGHTLTIYNNISIQGLVIMDAEL